MRPLRADHLPAIGRSDHGAQRPFVAVTVAIGSDRHQASSTQGSQASALRSNRIAGIRIVKRLQSRVHRLVPCPALDGQSALARRGTQYLGCKSLANCRRLLQTIQSGGGQDNRVRFALRQLGEPGIHIAAELYILEIRPPRAQLRLTAQAAGAHHSSRRKGVEAGIPLRDEHIAGIGPLRNRRQGKRSRPTP